MKKRFSYLMTLLCLLLCGASNSWADTEYSPKPSDSNVDASGTSFFILGSSYIAGGGSQSISLVDSKTDKQIGMKVRTSKALENKTEKKGVTIRVNNGYKITAVDIAFYSNSSNTAVNLDAVYVDGGEDILGGQVTSSSNTAAAVATKSLSGFTAKSHIELEMSGYSQAIMGIKFTYEKITLPKNETPTISFNATTGEVTITGDGAKYTTDGTDPSESNGTNYTAPFTVEDGTTVKAFVWGDGESSISSDIASELVLLTGITLSTPTISCVNGTVGISCSNPYVTIKYTLDGGAEQTYAYPFTLSKDANIAVTVSRDGCTSANANADVTAVPAAVKTKTVYFGFGSGDVTAAKDSEDGYSTLIGKAGDEAEGYSLTLLNEAKEWTSGQHRITYNGVTKTAIKLSNGAQNRINLPDGVKATKLTLISFVNSDPVSGVNGWKEINGEDMDYSTIPMGCSSANEKIDEKTYITNTPDVRVYPLDNVEGSITFNNGGTQLCFMLAIDVIEPTQKATISAGGYTTFCPVAYDVTIPDGVTAYTAAMNDAKDAVVLTEVAGGKLPKGCGVVLGGTAGETYKFEPTTDAAALAAENLMTGATADKTDLTDVYVLGVKDGSCLFGTWSGTTFPAGKAYLNYSPSLVGAPSIGIVFNDEATAISSLTNEQTKSGQGYNLAGQKVGNDFRGIVIVNGKKTIIK